MTHRSGRLLLRWSARDLRARWGLVAVIASIIAIGTGTFSGLGGTASWRRASNDASYSLLDFHDFRVELSTGTFADDGSLRSQALAIPHAEQLARVEERLVVPTQIDASAGDATVLVRGRLVGMSFDRDAVDALDLETGRLPDAGDQVVIESKFADHHGLTTPMVATLAGDRKVTLVGTGVTPEYFLVVGADESAVLAQAAFAVAFAPLANVQSLSDRRAQVNDLVVTIAPGADAALVELELRAAFEGDFGATVLSRDDDFGYRVLYDDIEGDQQVYRMLSFLVLGAAAVASYNLVSRIVEAQRREFGIQMALGVEPRSLAVRPLLLAAEIAVIGVVLGTGVGMLLASAMRSLFVELLPLPVWKTALDPVAYGQGALIGFLLPFVASLPPIRRAVRAEPVDAIRPGPSTTRPGRARARSRPRAKRSGLTRLPWRNIARSPRRTLLTAIGVGAAIAALVGVLGLLDSFTSTIRTGEDELLGDAPDRLSVELLGLQGTDSSASAVLCGLQGVARCDARLDVPATFSAGGEQLDVLLGFRDLDGAAWRPTIGDAADVGDTPGVILAAKAIDDLGLAGGDPFTARVPVARPDGTFATVDVTMAVAGRHANPLRSVAYADLRVAADHGFGGIVNGYDVIPDGTVGLDSLEREIFFIDGVASVESIGATAELFDSTLEQYQGFLVIVAGVVLVLGVLISFNTTSVAVDERRREHATLFAMGLPVHRVVLLLIAESVIVGIAATVVGVALGTGLVWWMVHSILASTIPELGITVSLSATTLGVALAIGVGAVAMTPLLVARRLRRMPLTDTLRVME